MPWTDSKNLSITVVGNPKVVITGVEAPSEVEVNKEVEVTVGLKVESTGAARAMEVWLGISSSESNPGNIVVTYKGYTYTIAPGGGESFIVDSGSVPDHVYEGKTYSETIKLKFTKVGNYVVGIYAGYSGS